MKVYQERMVTISYREMLDIERELEKLRALKKYKENELVNDLYRCQPGASTIGFVYQKYASTLSGEGRTKLKVLLKRLRPDQDFWEGQ